MVFTLEPITFSTSVLSLIYNHCLSWYFKHFFGLLPHSFFSYCLYNIFLQVPWEQSFCLGTRDTAQGTLLLQVLFFCRRSCFLWLGPLHQPKTCVGEEIWIQKGVLCNFVSLQPWSCHCLWLPMAQKYKQILQSWGEEKRNKTKDKWEVRGLMHSDAPRGQKNEKG